MNELLIPKDYHSELDLKDTQNAIKRVKDFFEVVLAKELNLTRVTAPLFVSPETGLNDNLNGVERPVDFDIKAIEETSAEIVHSLAKWKRQALGNYKFPVGEGLYTDMNAIRRDEDLDNIHSIFVDQWDWERVISKEDRNIDFLKDIVTRVYSAFMTTEDYIFKTYPYVGKILPDKITFITSQELEDKYPDLPAKEREYNAAKEFGAIFLMQIGDKLKSGKRHDGRAPDYDDWKLNGDIIVYYPVLDIALELSSMGIRVDEYSLAEQLQKAKCEDRANLPFQRAILEKRLPYTIGGGIGQSRICMFFLRKAHIGEVQCSIWPKEMIKEGTKAGMLFL